MDLMKYMSDEVLTWDNLEEKARHESDDSDDDKRPATVQSLPRSFYSLYGTYPKLETRIFSQCNVCEQVFNPLAVAKHREHCNEKDKNPNAKLLKKIKPSKKKMQIPLITSTSSPSSSSSSSSTSSLSSIPVAPVRQVLYYKGGPSSLLSSFSSSSSSTISSSSSSISSKSSPPEAIAKAPIEPVVDPLVSVATCSKVPDSVDVNHSPAPTPPPPVLQLPPPLPKLEKMEEEQSGKKLKPPSSQAQPQPQSPPKPQPQPQQQPPVSPAPLPPLPPPPLPPPLPPSLLPPLPPSLPPPLPPLPPPLLLLPPPLPPPLPLSPPPQSPPPPPPPPEIPAPSLHIQVTDLVPDNSPELEQIDSKTTKTTKAADPKAEVLEAVSALNIGIDPVANTKKITNSIQDNGVKERKLVRSSASQYGKHPKIEERRKTASSSSRTGNVVVKHKEERSAKEKPVAKLNGKKVKIASPTTHKKVIEVSSSSTTTLSSSTTPSSSSSSATTVTISNSVPNKPPLVAIATCSKMPDVDPMNSPIPTPPPPPLQANEPEVMDIVEVPSPSTPMEPTPALTKNKRKQKISKPFDPDKHCGVVVGDKGPCTRSLTCSIHKIQQRKAVPGRSKDIRQLIAERKKDNAGDQRRSTRASDLNPLFLQIIEDDPPTYKVQPASKIVTFAPNARPYFISDVQAAILIQKENSMCVPSDIPVRRQAPTKRLRRIRIIDERQKNRKYKSHPKPVTLPSFGVRKIGGSITCQTQSQRLELILQLNDVKETLKSLPPNFKGMSRSILMRKNVNKLGCKRNSTDKLGGAGDTNCKQIKLDACTNGIGLLHPGDPDDSDEGPSNGGSNGSISGPISLPENLNLLNIILNI